MNAEENGIFRLGSGHSSVKYPSFGTNGTEIILTAIRLDGIVSTRVIHHPDRAFAFEVTLDLLKGAKFFAQKPPLHFHANQAEYIQAIQGKTGLELEGREIVLSPGSPEYYIGSWVNHRSYPISIPLQDGVEKVKFLLSGAKTPEPFQLNTLFFENWYRYQENVLSTGKRIDLIQILSVS